MGAKSDYVERIDKFFAAPKELVIADELAWKKPARDAIGLTVKFPISVDGELSGETLQVTSFAKEPLDFKISLFFGNAIISRLDWGRQRKHVNQPPPRGVVIRAFKGTHYHHWPDNKMCATHACHWQLRFATDVPDSVRNFEAAFRWFCDQNTITQPRMLFELEFNWSLL